MSDGETAGAVSQDEANMLERENVSAQGEDTNKTLPAEPHLLDEYEPGTIVSLLTAMRILARPRQNSRER